MTPPALAALPLLQGSGPACAGFGPACCRRCRQFRRGFLPVSAPLPPARDPRGPQDPRRAASTRPNGVAATVPEPQHKEQEQQQGRQHKQERTQHLPKVTAPVGHPLRDPYGLPSFLERLSSPPVQRRVRTLEGGAAIPAESKEFAVAGNCEVQLDDELVVGMAAMGRTPCCLMTIKWVRRVDGEDCSYGQWLAERGSTPTVEARACNLEKGGAAAEDEVEGIPNRVALLANCVKLVAYGAGKHSVVSVYQRLPSSFAMTGFTKVPL